MGRGANRYRWLGTGGLPSLLPCVLRHGLGRGWHGGWILGLPFLFRSGLGDRLWADKPLVVGATLPGGAVVTLTVAADRVLGVVGAGSHEMVTATHGASGLSEAVVAGVGV